MKYLLDVEAKTKRGNIKYLDNLRAIARKNRNNPTQSEFIMWQYLRKNSFGYKFTRQKPIFRFVLDFYCSKLLLAIEVDGNSHDLKSDYDSERNKYLERMNIRTIRFTNDEVLNNFFKVKEKLLPLIKSLDPL
ncbi:MAG: endonuclease domain-containing protein [Candidatus Shapirobacteria bacterium]|nr:endonuclease domain-containing protein [Candidatus Shapirobacteria bacterium]